MTTEDEERFQKVFERFAREIGSELDATIKENQDRIANQVKKELQESESKQRKRERRREKRQRQERRDQARRQKRREKLLMGLIGLGFTAIIALMAVIQTCS